MQRRMWMRLLTAGTNRLQVFELKSLAKRAKAETWIRDCVLLLKISVLLVQNLWTKMSSFVRYLICFVKAAPEVLVQGIFVSKIITHLSVLLIASYGQTVALKAFYLHTAVILFFLLRFLAA